MGSHEPLKLCRPPLSPIICEQMLSSVESVDPGVSFIMNRWFERVELRGEGEMRGTLGRVGKEEGGKSNVMGTNLDPN